MLNAVQSAYYRDFEKIIEMKDSLLFTSKERAWGKTTIINELGLTLQALGFRPLIITLSGSHTEYFATDFLQDLNHLRGLGTDGLVILVDEYKRSKLEDILEYCRINHIPIVGFVNFE